MSAFGSRLFNRLIGDTVIASALVIAGTSPPKYRIYPNVVKEGHRRELIVMYSIIGARNDEVMGDTVGFSDRLYQIDVFGPINNTVGVDLGAEDLAYLIRDRLSRWSDRSGSGVQDTFLQSITGGWDDDSELHRYRLTVKFIVDE